MLDPPVERKAIFLYWRSGSFLRMKTRLRRTASCESFLDGGGRRRDPLGVVSLVSLPHSSSEVEYLKKVVRTS